MGRTENEEGSYSLTSKLQYVILYIAKENKIDVAHMISVLVHHIGTKTHNQVCYTDVVIKRRESYLTLQGENHNVVSI